MKKGRKENFSQHGKMKIRARHKRSLKVVELEYKTIKEAKFRNPHLEDFVKVQS